MSDSTLNSQTIGTVYPNDGTGSPDTSHRFYPNTVKSLTIAYNRVVNSNGSQIQGYNWVQISDPTGGSYTVYKLVYSPSGETVTGPDVAAYMKHMTGSDYIPYYSANQPNDCFIFLTDPSLSEDSRTWKYQYMEGVGLLTFRVDNFPFATKAFVENYVDQHGGGSSMPMRISFAYNFVVNSNGSIYEGYKWSDATDPTGGGYTVKLLRYSGNDEPVRDLDTIKDYLKAMTGTDFLPEYNQTYPQDTFIYLSSPDYTDENRVWKYQYTYNSTVGEYFLYAFKVNNFPFALKSEIPQLPKTFVIDGVVDTTNNLITYTLQTNLLGISSKISISVMGKDNNNSYGRTEGNFVFFSNLWSSTGEMNRSGIFGTSSFQIDSETSSEIVFLSRLDTSVITGADINEVKMYITLF